MKKTTLATVTMTLGVTALLWTSACDPLYTTRRVRAERIPEGSTVAISVYGGKAKGTNLTALDAYLTAALLGRGYKVQTIKLELLAGRDVLNRILCTMCKAKMGGGGGGLFGKVSGGGSKKQKAEGSGDLAKAPARFEALTTLLGELSAKLKAQYHLVVHQMSDFSYATYVVDRKEEKIINVFVISANYKGFAAKMGNPIRGKTAAKADHGDVSNMHLLTLAEWIARRL